MSVNYFENLGFGRAMNRPFEVAQSMSNLQTQSLNRDLATQEGQRQQQTQQDKMSAFNDTKIKQRTAEASGLIYSALSSGQPERAAQLAAQFENEFKTLDPTFSAQGFAQMASTPEGLKQLQQETLTLSQIMAGPEQVARFTAQQAKPESQSQLPLSVRELQYYESLKEKDPIAAEAFGKKTGLIETKREQAQTEAERNLERYQALLVQDKELARQFGQQVGLVSKEGRELSANSQKRLSTFTDDAVESGRLEQKYMTLAEEFQKSGIQGGLFGIGGAWRETIKDLSGEQDAITSLRKEFLKVRGSEVVSNLPPGAASDADVAMALAGFPTERSNGEQVAGFLRGIAKLKGFEKQFNEFKAAYISEKGSERGMLQSWKEQSAQKQPAQQSSDVVDWSAL